MPAPVVVIQLAPLAAAMPPRVKKASKTADKTNGLSKGTKRTRDTEEYSDKEEESHNGRKHAGKKSRISESSTEVIIIQPVLEKDNTASVSPSSDSDPDILKKELIGNFDLYSMRLPFLSEVFLEKGKANPQYEALYERILSYQAKDDNSLQLYLPKVSSTERGRIRSTVDAMCDPMEEMPFDVEVDDVTTMDTLTFERNERDLFLGPPTNGPGFKGKLSVLNGGCGIGYSSGVIKLKSVWKSTEKGASGTFAELYEGIVTFNVSYSSIYKRKGHGRGESLKTGIWAVRARRDDNGEEVGIGPLKPKTNGWY